MAKSKVKQVTIPVKEVPRREQFKNKAGQVFMKGMRVRLGLKAFKLNEKLLGNDIQARLLQAPSWRPTAKVQSLSDIKGLVFLETKLGGYWSWFVDDLEVV